VWELINFTIFECIEPISAPASPCFTVGQ
jgi:hypothetical protein